MKGIATGTVIESALLRLGELGSYNNNTSAIYKRAEGALKLVVERTATDTTFLYNSKTVKLTRRFETTNEFGEYTFNPPTDFINKVRNVNCEDLRREGEYFYSKNPEPYIQYCRKLPLIETPTYMQEYFINSLALEMTRTHNTYIDKQPYFEYQMTLEKAKILANEDMEFTQVNRDRIEDIYGGGF